jgi:dTDP-4-amino-4,6-dideoxygalactose transaminase
MDRITDIALKDNIYVIEDAAQAMGCEYYSESSKTLKAGTIGHLGCTSFFPSKTLACFGDGGAVITDDDELADKIRAISNHGMKVKYYHDIVGVNSRLDGIQAAILDVKLKYLEKYNKARQVSAEIYDNAFRNISGITIPSRSEKSNHIFHQYTLKVSGINRDELKMYLETKEIPAMIYYPVPLHMQKAFTGLGYKEGDFPVTEELCKTVISLPMHTELGEDQIEFIIRSVIDFINK